MVGDPVEKEYSKTFAAEPLTQLAEEELIIRVIQVGVQELGDSLVLPGQPPVATGSVIRSLLPAQLEPYPAANQWPARTRIP